MQYRDWLDRVITACDCIVIINSLTPRICDSYSRSVILKLVMQNDSFATRCEIAVRRMPRNVIDG